MKSAVVLVLLAVATGFAVAAPTVVIYRCVGADGQVTIQNGSKCPKGSKEQKRVVETPTSTPARPVLAPAPAPVTPVVPVAAVQPMGETGATTPAPAAAAALLPAPALYVCLTADARRYYSETEQSAHCAPLTAVGLDGRTPTNAEACEVVDDHCEAVPEAERCAAWAERRRKAEQALTFAPEQVEQARAELAHVDAMTAQTVCGR
ncbi:DUF4124 domain-containing protein [Lysobacter sp. TY2-98]|uniref:DUF4124 domain-containing protein n=1 Tax=Lysobacter sp. TY2-98 TaxID=2290922 RepID=UPI000E200FBB|nr:DUF4124 domain-containing protein [Lysobacter sp. TY2-98]AXK73396.1 DUF4124 domain-containing protein [Lysobacter sp. TY2-98]